MPLIETPDGPVWKRRATKETLIRWFCWLIAIAIIPLIGTSVLDVATVGFDSAASVVKTRTNPLQHQSV